MPNRRLLVLGSTNTDLVVRGPRLPAPGETVLGGQFYEAAGGKGANQAVAVARAAGPTGPAVTFVSAVGDDLFGRKWLDRVAQEGIECQFIKIVAGQPSGVALILVDQNGENLISVASGANACLLPADIDALPDHVFQDTAVFLASLELPLATVVRGLERAEAAGALTILNPAPAVAGTAAPEVLRLVDVLTPNKGEAASLIGRPASTPADALADAQQLMKRGCGSVIATLGAAGCLVVEKTVPCEIAGLPVHAVDATAAGDAFNGALAVALCEGKSLAEAATGRTARRPSPSRAPARSPRCRGGQRSKRLDLITAGEELAVWQFSIRTMMFAVFVIAAGAALVRLGQVAAAWCIAGALCGAARPKRLAGTVTGGAVGATVVCYPLWFFYLSARSPLDLLWLACPFVPGAIVGALVWLFRELCQEVLEFWRGGVPPDHLR